MGWVEDKIKDRRATEKFTTVLWNALRDSIGDAVTDFQVNVHLPEVSSKDCKARAPLCMRVEKGGSFIEIFLVKDDQSIQKSGDGDGDSLIARYRLKADKSGLQFYREGEGSDVILTADMVARCALEDFLFTPFPLATIVKQ